MSAQTTETPVPEVIAKEMAADRALRREERQSLTAIPAADLAAAPQRTSFLPTSMGEAMQLATIMSRSSFVPAHCRGNEGNCIAIVMQAARWGMDPFAVANKAYFVKDGAPPAFEAQLINAVVNSSGALSGRLRIHTEGEGEKLRCTVSGFLRADPNDEKVKTQSIARITTRNSPLWKNDPEQQLAYYTTRAWARLHCPEVLLGVFTPDEVDVDPEMARNVTPPMPRRSALPDLGHDPQTGEILDEATARALDSEGFAAMEGRTDAQHGDQHDDTASAAFTDIMARIEAAALIADVLTIEASYQAGRALFEVAEQDQIEAAIDAAKAKMKGGK